MQLLNLRDRFVLQGAMLFRVWSGSLHRPTKDVDLLEFGEPTPTSVAAMIGQIITTTVEDDGIRFDAASIRAEDIRPSIALPMVAALCGFPARPRFRPNAGLAPRRRYERRRPEKTPLHKIIPENLASWLEWRDEAERPVPGYVEEELRGYLECGILCFGFGRALCTGCGQGFVIAARLSRARQPWEPLAFPSVAWQDGAMDGPPCLWLAPPVPVRQWVISVPKRLRVEPDVRSVEGQDGFARVKSAPHTPRRAARASARLSRPRPADRLARARAGP